MTTGRALQLRVLASLSAGPGADHGRGRARLQVMQGNYRIKHTLNHSSPRLSPAFPRLYTCHRAVMHTGVGVLYTSEILHSLYARRAGLHAFLIILFTDILLHPHQLQGGRHPWGIIVYTRVGGHYPPSARENKKGLPVSALLFTAAE